MDDERRIYYTLTGLGRKALEAELDRYRDVVAVATEKHLTPNAFADGSLIGRSADTAAGTPGCSASTRGPSTTGSASR